MVLKDELEIVVDEFRCTLLFNKKRCEKVFSSGILFAKHILARHEKKSLTCEKLLSNGEICGKEFVMKHDLTKRQKK